MLREKMNVTAVAFTVADYRCKVNVMDASEDVHIDLIVFFGQLSDKLFYFLTF